MAFEGSSTSALTTVQCICCCQVVFSNAPSFHEFCGWTGLKIQTFFESLVSRILFDSDMYYLFCFFCASCNNVCYGFFFVLKCQQTNLRMFGVKSFTAVCVTLLTDPCTDHRIYLGKMSPLSIVCVLLSRVRIVLCCGNLEVIHSSYSRWVQSRCRLKERPSLTFISLTLPTVTSGSVSYTHLTLPTILRV